MCKGGKARTWSGKLRTALRYAMREFWRSFAWPGKPAPGGRDFFVLTLLCAILIETIALVAAAGEGISANFARALLGNLPGYGFPIWVTINAENYGHRLDMQTLSQFRNAPGISRSDDQQKRRPGDPILSTVDIFPVEEIEPKDLRVSLPCAGAGVQCDPEQGNPPVWNTQPGPIDFKGWGVAADDPLWRSAFDQEGVAVDQSKGLRIVVLNEALFDKHFNYEAYVRALRDRLPKPVFEQLPEHHGDLKTLKVIYLDTAFRNAHKRLLPYEVVWVESLPALEKVAMLFPLPLLGAAQLVLDQGGPSENDKHDEDKKLALTQPEDQDEEHAPDRVLSRASIVDVDLLDAERQKIVRNRFQQLAECLGPGAVNRSADDDILTLEFDEGMLPKAWSECRKRAGLDPEKRLRSSYHISPMLKINGLTLIVGGQGPTKTVEIPAFTNYRIANVYVADFSAIEPVTQSLRDNTIDGNHQFLITEIYQDALNRLHYAIVTIRWIGVGVAVLGLMVVVILLMLQLTPLIERRRPYYGMLLARGMSSWAILFALLAQVLLAAVMGFCIAFVGAEVLKAIIASHFATSEVATFAKHELGIQSPVLLPSVNFSNPAAVVSGLREGFLLATLSFLPVMLVATGFAVLRALRLPLLPSTTPVELLVNGAGARKRG
jgi:hypothetical protein